MFQLLNFIALIDHTDDSKRLLRVALIVVCLLCSLPFAGCTFEPPPALPGVDYFFHGDRFIPEPVKDSALMPSDLFWLADSELVFVNWDNFILRYHAASNWISECDICGPQSQVTFEDDKWTVHCNSLNVPEGEGVPLAGRPEVRVLERDLPIADVLRIRKKVRYEDGCINSNPAASDFLPDGRTAYPNSFFADRDARYTLQAVIPHRSGTVDEGELLGDLGESTLEVHVVREGVPARVLPQTLEPGQSDMPGQVWVWEWRVAVNDGKWDMNFSNRLRVTRVRVLKGRRDERTNRFRPSDPMNPYVVPYRIEAGSNLCYASRNSEDGDIDLRRCRQSPDDSGGTSVLVTPTYVDTNIQNPLTWKVIFDSREGFSPPIFVEGEELAIEFTLEVR